MTKKSKLRNIVRFMAITALSLLHPMCPTALSHPHSLATESECKFRVLGWIPYWDQKRATDTFKKHVGLFDTVSAFWYYIDKKGRIRTYRDAVVDKSLLTFARENGVKVLAVVTNSPDNGKDSWDRKRVKRLIESPERRQSHIKDLVRLATGLGFDGINIDYEALAAKDRENFSDFVEELASSLHAEGKILAVALHPKTVEFSPAENNGSHAQDWAAIDKAADQLHLMTYGRYNSETPPGPPAPPNWVERVLQHALNKNSLSTEKLFVGIPLYAEEWKSRKCEGDTCYKGTNKDLTFSEVRNIMEEEDISPDWSEGQKTPFLKARNKVVWFENARSAERKLKMIMRNGIGNVAFWRLGGEDEQIWPLLERTFCKLQSQEKRKG